MTDSHPLHREDVPALRDALATWFRARGRRLAFREHATPWGVMVSEVMAQQTQIARVEPAWAAFMDRFPTPASLAVASPAEVLRAWAGMGYNRRALNLQRAASMIVDRHAGQVPRMLEALEALPGVGRYTARAVAAIAFGMPVAAVDTNVRRVVGRVVAGHGAVADAAVPLRAGELQAVADGLVDPADPGAWTHAVMDLGATICRPANPRCDTCPLAAWCARRAAELLDGAARPDEAARPRATRRAPGAGDRLAADPPFPATRRWLRGRIVAMSRDLPDGSWTTIRGSIGDHDAAAVEAALADLASEGMIELRPDGEVRLPSTRR